MSQEPEYEELRVSVEQRVTKLLAKMTLEEKVALLSGTGFKTRENERLGIPEIRMSDGPAGVRYGKATAFPSPVALAATWDTGLVKKVGKVIARELKSKGRNMLLAPCVNILRHPLGGRNFESYGEDPFLAGRMAASFIQGVQEEKVIASVKHYACNNQEWQRHAIDVRVRERALREIYLYAFKTAVKDGGVWSVMAAYNKLRGKHCSENEYLLNTILKEEWEFDGFVVSDWGAVYSAEEAASAGLDLEMPFGEHFGDSLLMLVRDTIISEKMIDEKVIRLLRIMFRAGIFDEDYEADTSVIYKDEHHQLALEAARESIVLLKNQNGILPLDMEEIKSIAVIGPNAFEARTGGGGSSQVDPLYAVSPLEGIRNIAGEKVTIHTAWGTPAMNDIIPLESRFFEYADSVSDKQGLLGEYFYNLDFYGEPVKKKIDKQINFNWGYDGPVKHYYGIKGVRWTGRIIPPTNGNYTLNVIHNDGCRVYINDQLIIDAWEEGGVRKSKAGYVFDKDKSYKLRVEYFTMGGISRIKFGWERSWEDLVSIAAYRARHADVAIIFAGLSNNFESESFDRESMDLPRQDALIKAVCDANPNTIVVMQAGSQVIMEPWIRDIPAVLYAWYPGQEGGNAIAEILFGKQNPSGKLPLSLYWRKSDSPAFRGYKNENPVVNYHEDIYVGYRYLDKNGIKPMFPFGHGLTYSTIGIGKLLLWRGDRPDQYVATVEIKNMGERTGSEVIQLYIQDTVHDDRPLKELKAFRKIRLRPGEKQVIRIPLERSDFAVFDEASMTWVVRPGNYNILVGTSAGNIKLRKTLYIR